MDSPFSTVLNRLVKKLDARIEKNEKAGGFINFYHVCLCWSHRQMLLIGLSSSLRRAITCVCLK